MEIKFNEKHNHKSYFTQVPRLFGDLREFIKKNAFTSKKFSHEFMNEW